MAFPLNVTIIEAPSVLGLFPKVVETLPDALLAAGLGERLKARRSGRLEPPPYDDRRDRRTLSTQSEGRSRPCNSFECSIADRQSALKDMADVAQRCAFRHSRDNGARYRRATTYADEYWGAVIGAGVITDSPSARKSK